MEEFDLNKSNSQTQQKDSFDYDMQKDFFKLTSSFGDQSDDYLNWKDDITLTYEEVSFVCYKVSESNKYYSEDSKLEIALDCTPHVRRIEQLARFKLPNLRAIGILSISEEPELAYKFLTNSIPDQLESLYIGGDSFLKPKLSGVLPLIVGNASKITKELWIRLYTVTQSDLIVLMLAFPHIKTLGFYDCSFGEISSNFKLSSVIDFAIQELSFEESLDDSLTSKSIGNIIYGISKTTLKSSLKEINLTRCGCLSTDINIKLKKYGMEHVSIETEKHWYFYNL